MFCTRRKSIPRATTLSHIILVLFIICSIVHAQSPPAPTIEVSNLVIKKLDKDGLDNSTSDNITTKTVTIVLETQKTHDSSDDDSDSGDSSWQNGGHVKPYMVATGEPSATIQPGDTATPDSGAAATAVPNDDAADDNALVNQDQSTVRRMILISSIVGTVGFVSLLAAATLLYIRKKDRKRRGKQQSSDIELDDQSRGPPNNDSTSSVQPMFQQPTTFVLPDETQSRNDSQPSAPMLAPLPMAHGSGNNTMRRHYLEIPNISSAVIPTRTMRNLAHTQSIAPPSAPTAKEIHAEDENLYRLVGSEYSSSARGQRQSTSRRHPSFQDDSSVTSSQDAPPAYTPSAPPLYFYADYPEATGTSRSRQQSRRTTPSFQPRHD